jgi:hypothetical protein
MSNISNQNKYSCNSFIRKTKPGGGPSFSLQVIFKQKRKTFNLDEQHWNNVLVKT